MALFNQSIMTSATNQIFEDNKRSVTLYRATKEETNVTGSEQITYGTAEEIEIIFFYKQDYYNWQIEGLMKLGDCMIFDKPNNINISRDDKIETDGKTYIIVDVLPWNSGELNVYEQATGILL